MTSSTDLSSKIEIRSVIQGFYGKIVDDVPMMYLFTDVAEVDWAVHIDKMTAYWCRVLLHEPGYSGRILKAHQNVHNLEPISTDMFNRWYGLWVESVDSQWSGPFADKAKSHAAKIMSMLAKRIRQENWSPRAYNVDEM